MADVAGHAEPPRRPEAGRQAPIQDWRTRSNWLIGLGVLGIVLGFIGLFLIPGLTLAGVIWYGVLLVVLGIAQAVETMVHWSSSRDDRWMKLVLAALYIVAGAVILLNPILAIVALTLLIGIALIVFGIARGVMALRLSGGVQVWAFISAALSIVLGALILARWPSSSVWVIGLFIAVELITYGIQAIAAGSQMKDQARRLATT